MVKKVKIVSRPLFFCMRNRIYFIQIFWDLISVLVTSHIQNRNCDPLPMDVNHLIQCFCKQMESGFAREDFFSM